MLQVWNLGAKDFKFFKVSEPYYEGETINLGIYLNNESLVVLPQTDLKLKFVNANLSEWFFSNFMALLEYINCTSSKLIWNLQNKPQIKWEIWGRPQPRLRSVLGFSYEIHAKRVSADPGNLMLSPLGQLVITLLGN